MQRSKLNINPNLESQIDQIISANFHKTHNLPGPNVPIARGKFEVLFVLIMFLISVGSYIASTRLNEIQKYKVHISGEVVSPGVYQVDSSKRLIDAIALSGGLKESASIENLEKTQNLASFVRDGQKIHVPKLEDADPNTYAATESLPVSLNTSTQAELESLPGVGEVTALRIISNRPYTSINDLVDRKILKKSLFTKIYDLISL